MSRTDSASRVIDASPERIYDAFVDPEALCRWLPPSGMSAVFEHFEARAGGTYRLVLTYGDPSVSAGKATPDSDVIEARFVELCPGERVTQEVDFESDDLAFTGTMTMTWEIAPVGSGARVTFTATNVPDGITAADHAVGLASSLSNLARHLGDGPADRRRL